jgi:hypothetical protein
MVRTYICLKIPKNFKGKFQPRPCHEGSEVEQRYSSIRGGRSTPRSGRFLPPGKTIVQGAGLTPGPVWRGAENLAPKGIRSPDRPARSHSLYRLRYLAHLLCTSTFVELFEIIHEIFFAPFRKVATQILCLELVDFMLNLFRRPFNICTNA